MDKQSLLELRKNKKKVKPHFVRRNYRKLKLRDTWRKPRGLHNKLRLKRKGHIKNPSIGYRSPASIRYMDKNGLIPILISNIHDVNKLDPNKNSLIISSTVGIKNKIKLLEKVAQLDFRILNFKDVNSASERMKQIFEARKRKRSESVKLKQEKKSKTKEIKPETKQTKEDLDKEKQDILLHEKQIQPKQIHDVQDKSPRMNVTRTKITPGEKQ
ncbi:hypothetical protein J4471_00405 [Candidatus Woesearchaeota archaeon]|nr:hypothetical protein [Candidatus Woesearchaeota archaeon]